MMKLVLFAGLVVAVSCQLQASLDKKPEEKHGEDEEVTFLMPDRPEEFKDYPEISIYADIYLNRLTMRDAFQKLRTDDPNRKPVQTFVISTNNQWERMIKDKDNILKDPKHPRLIDYVLQAGMSHDVVKVDDEKMITPEGLKVKNMNGEELIFKKDPRTRQLTVNDLRITESHNVEGKNPYTIYMLDGLLFETEKRINDAKAPAIHQ